MSITAMKLALEALEEINKLSIGENAISLSAEIDTAMDALRQAIAKAEQSNVSTNDTSQDHVAETSKNVHEPVALEAVYETIIQWDEGGGKRSRRELARRINALYTTPPQRKPLTRGQIREIEVDVSLNPSFDYITPAEQLCRAIEAAHGIGEKE